MYVIEYRGLPISVLSISEMQRWCNRLPDGMWNQFTIFYVDCTGKCWAVTRETL